MKTIAVVEKSENLAAALSKRISEKYPTHTIQVVNRIGEAPAGALIASLGLPSYVPASHSKVASVGTKMTKDEAERKAQWETIRNPESTTEEILEHLDRIEVYNVISERAAVDVKMELFEHKQAIAEAAASGDNEALLAAYKAGFELLSKQLA